MRRFHKEHLIRLNASWKVVGVICLRSSLDVLAKEPVSHGETRPAGEYLYENFSFGLINYNSVKPWWSMLIVNMISVHFLLNKRLTININLGCQMRIEVSDLGKITKRQIKIYRLATT